ncbi:MAG: acyl carrier protein [Parcubacteria group bacterium]|nr:acyl carrier protein [Parcubacteria group bacterium]
MPISDDDLDASVTRLICEAAEVDAEDVSSDTRLMGDLDLDSLDIIELVMAVEDEFVIVIHDGDVDGLTTIEDVINYVREHA